MVSAASVVDLETREKRAVMYKGFMSELFVPYMDPTDAWHFKMYMDAREYGFGLQAMPLVPLNDCPRNAYYMDGVFLAADGRPYVQSNMVCLFERYTVISGGTAGNHISFLSALFFRQPLQHRPLLLASAHPSPRAFSSTSSGQELEWHEDHHQLSQEHCSSSSAVS